MRGIRPRLLEGESKKIGAEKTRGSLLQTYRIPRKNQVGPPGTLEGSTLYQKMIGVLIAMTKALLVPDRPAWILPLCKDQSAISRLIFFATQGVNEMPSTIFSQWKRSPSDLKHPFLWILCISGTSVIHSTVNAYPATSHQIQHYRRALTLNSYHVPSRR